MVGRLRVRGICVGSGPPVVLLHGAGESALDWVWVLPALTGRYTVYVPDLPRCHGTSAGEGRLSESFSVRVLTEFLHVCDAPVVVVGNSLGGIAAARVAASNRDHVAALVLIGSLGLGRAINPLISRLTLPGIGETAVSQR